MAPKRKSDAIEFSENAVAGPSNTTDPEVKVLEPSLKKARVANTPGGSGSASNIDKPQFWTDVKLPGEGADGGVPVYDDCADVRRKIRLLLQTPNFKVTHWLQQIGINSNSYGRFMREKGRTDGAGNGTYYAAYVYFEKVRVLEGKKKTAKRSKNEKEMPSGYLLESSGRGYWVLPK